MTRDDIKQYIGGKPMLLTSFKYEGKYNVELYYNDIEGMSFQIRVFTLGRYPRLVYESASVCMGLILNSLKNIEFCVEHFPSDPKKRYSESIEELNNKYIKGIK
ncbi:MAG: hypothetical protein J6T33_08150 [Bacteroidales bacterium]|nr:hypothetical protein [Bacteroidales bacterium]MBO7541614.1 hypothetical protein [Bacteroidales bacterium]